MLLGTGLMGVVVLLVSVAGLRARPPLETPRTQQAGVAAPAGPLPPLAWPRPAGDRSGAGAGAPLEAPASRRSPQAAAAGGTTTGLVLRSPYRGPIERVQRAPVAKPGTAQPGTPSATAAGPSPGAGGSAAAGRPTASAASPAAEAGPSVPPGRAALLGGPITLDELRP